mgnify:CR=1 FL=1
MKKQSNLSRLMGYAGGHKILTYLSWVLSVMSALLALVPFWYIWCIIHDILEVSPDFSQAENVTGDILYSGNIEKNKKITDRVNE